MMDRPLKFLAQPEHSELAVCMVAVAQMFTTEAQQATLSNFLWDQEKTKELLTYMRLYDLIRRIYYVKVGEYPRPEYVVSYMETFLKSPIRKRQFVEYVQRSGFPLYPKLKAIDI